MDAKFTNGGLLNRLPDSARISAGRKAANDGAKSTEGKQIGRRST